MTKYVSQLADASEDAALVGGKAASLGRLMRARLPVPDGFVLTTEGYRAVRDGESWPEELRGEIEAAYSGLMDRAGGAPVAVRSSATGEDAAGASFAGQHATVLNVRDLDELLDAVATCWASLHEAHAAEYRRQRGVDDADAAMAVVVQALVPAEASGVAFTIDPVSGVRDVVLIDAVYGLGEGAVGGTITPDHFAVRKSDGALARSEITEKQQRIVANKSGGITTEDTPERLRERPVLEAEQLAELSRLALRCEQLAGVPQDVEWALAEGKFYILQSRPVTAVAAQPELEDWVSEFDTVSKPDTVWTAANVQEVLPDQLSPFNCSINLRMLDEHGTKAVERTGVRLNDSDPFNAMFYGKAFLNVTLTADVSDQIPFSNVDAIMEQYYEVPPDLLPKPTPLSPAKVWRYINVVPRMTWFTLRYGNDVKRAEAIIARFEKELAEKKYQDFNDDELLSAVDEGLDPGADVAITHISGAGLTGAMFDVLRGLTRSWLADETGELHARLCTGLAGLESAQPAYDLWDLSRLVISSARLREAFSPPDGVEIERRLNALEGDDIEALRRGVAGFLKRHGYRSVMEAEVAAKSWSEDLPTVYAMIRNYIHADESASPRLAEDRQRRAREAATEEALLKLGWWKRGVFKYVLRIAQEGLTSREHTKSLLVRGTQHGREYTRELARRLVDRGLLDDMWDLYYLRWEEVPAFVRGEMSRDAAYVEIARRKKEEERNRHVVVPEVFRGRPKPLRPSDIPLPDGDTLRGLAVSPGRVTGRARVIMDPRVDAVIEPGEILVAPVTDAGWTPLFVAAAGVVVDVGGTLSHGSTVAREYGLPAVVNVKHGTRMIRTGQTITVDGTQGVVVLGRSP